MRILMTKFIKKAEVTSSWFEIDAKNAVVGRLASVISKIIRGKNKNTFTIRRHCFLTKPRPKIDSDGLKWP